MIPKTKFSENRITRPVQITTAISEDLWQLAKKYRLKWCECVAIGIRVSVKGMLKLRKLEEIEAKKLEEVGE